MCPATIAFLAMHAVGVLPQPDATQEDIFRTLVQRNAINMHAPAHSVEFAYRDTALGAIPAPRDGADRARHYRKGNGMNRRTKRSSAHRQRQAARPQHLGVAGPLPLRPPRTSGMGLQTAVVHSACARRRAPAPCSTAVDAADLFLLAAPLYVDGLPHLVTTALERIAAHRP